MWPSTKRSRRLRSWAVPPHILPAPPDETAELLPDRFRRWFAGRGWSPREHQLALLAKARDDRSALLIAPTGAGKTLAGFLPTLVELSASMELSSSKELSSSRKLSASSHPARSSPLPPRSGGEGSGVGGGSASPHPDIAYAEAPPTPAPGSSPGQAPSPPRAARAGGGEK